MLLQLNHIYKTYEQGKIEVPVLKDISLSVEAGEYMAIMGPSGSGKTTLMNLIGCLDYPSQGEFFLEGEDVFKYNDAELSNLRLHSIGFVFQSFHLLPRQSALENVALPLIYAGIKKAERLKIAQAMLERVGLADRINFKPTQLSGGQCQRVAIARAMVNNPKILLADEPTGALDTVSGQQIMELFQTLNNEGVTIVMITHEQMVADHANKIYHIMDGRFINYPESHTVKAAQTPLLHPEEGIDRQVQTVRGEVVSSITAPAALERQTTFSGQENLRQSAATSKNWLNAEGSRYKENIRKEQILQRSNTEKNSARKSTPSEKKDQTPSQQRYVERSKSLGNSADRIEVSSPRGTVPLSTQSLEDFSSKNQRPNRGKRRPHPLGHVTGTSQGQFRNPIKTEIQFTPSSRETDKGEE